MAYIYMHMLTFFLAYALTFYLAFYLAPILTYFLAFYLQFWLSFWQSFWHSNWHIYIYCILSGVLSDIYSGILPGILLSSILSGILSGMSSGPGPLHSLLLATWHWVQAHSTASWGHDMAVGCRHTPDLGIWHSGQGTLHSIRSWRRRRGEEEGEEEGEEGVAPLLKSRDPHLAGHWQVGNNYCTYNVSTYIISNHWSYAVTGRPRAASGDTRCPPPRKSSKMEVTCESQG